MSPDLATLLRDHVAVAEPAFTLTGQDAFRVARRRQTVRRTGLTTAAVAVVAAAAVVVPSLTGGGSAPDRTLDAASAEALAEFDATAFPETFDANVTETLTGQVPDFAGEEVTASDSQGQELPARYHDKATVWTATYTWSDTHWVDVHLFHSGSESEGDAERYCADGLESGYDLACTVDTGPNGEVLLTTVGAMRKDPTTVGDEVTWIGVTHAQGVDPDRLWFAREVEARRGGIYLASAREVVKAPSLEAAKEAFRASPALLREVALDPELVFPEPPTDENGCPWTIPGTGFSCTG